MAIANITKSFSSRIFKLRVPRSKPKAASPGGGGMPSPKTTAEDEEFRQVFRFLDSDNDGMISAGELKAYFASVGESVSHADAVKIIKEFSNGGDDASNSLLSFEEFARIMELQGGGDDDVVLRQAFEVYEVEKGSGCITAEGLREVLRRLGDVKTLQECRAIIAVYDLDGNGVLDFNEFHKMMI